MKLTKFAKSGLSEELSNVISMVWIAHLAVISYIMLSYLFAFNNYRRGTRLLLASLFHWDADNYMNIARIGYEVDWQIVFFPLYPFLIALFTFFLRSPVIAALVITFVSHLVGSYYFYRLLVLDIPKADAKMALFFSLIFPTAFYAVVPYTESMFLMFAITSYYCFRKRNFFWTGILGFLAVITRPTGLAVTAMVFAEYFFVMRKDIHWKKVFFPIFFPCFGMLIIFLLNYAYYGDILYFVHKEQAGWSKHLTFPHVGFLKSWEKFTEGKRFLNPIDGFNELLGTSLIWTVTVYSFFRLRKSYAFFCLASCILTTFQSSWQSSLRYAYAVFPLYILFARIAKNEMMKYLLVAASLLYLAVLAGHYSKGHWVQ